MKRKFYLLSAMALILTGSIFYACQKDEIATTDEEVILKAAPNPKIDPIIEISSNPASPVVDGTSVTITATTNQNCGTIWIESYPDGTLLTAKVDLTDAVKSVTYTYDAEFGNNRSFVAKSNAGGGDCNFNAAHTSSITIEVIEDNCSEPLSIGAERVADKYEDGWYYFAAQYHVHACEAFTNLKVQGGLTAGAELVTIATDFNGTSYQTSLGYEAKFTKKNAIINWKETAIDEGFDKTYTVVFKRKLSAECTEYDITGAWSAKAWHFVTHSEPIYDENGVQIGEQDVTVNEEYVAGYDNKLYFTTSCPI